MIRTRQPLSTSEDVAKMEPLLELAQRNLPGGRFGSPRRIVTPKGFAGVEIAGTFTPAGHTERYQRVHVVVLDTTGALVHVMYTAKDLGAEASPLRVVLDTLQRGDG